MSGVESGARLASFDREGEVAIVGLGVAKMAGSPSHRLVCDSIQSGDGEKGLVW